MTEPRSARRRQHPKLAASTDRSDQSTACTRTSLAPTATTKNALGRKTRKFIPLNNSNTNSITKN